MYTGGETFRLDRSATSVGILDLGPVLATSLAATACWRPDRTRGCRASPADRRGTWTGAGLTATGGPEGWRLTSRRWVVIAGHAAALLVVLAGTESGDALFAAEAEAEAPGPSLAPMTAWI